MTDPTKTSDAPEAADEAPQAPESDGSQAPESDPQKPKSRWGWRAALAAVGGASMVAGGVWISQTVNGGGAELREQSARIAALETERAILRTALTDAQANTGALTIRMDAVENTLAALTDAVGGAVPAADFGVLAADVDARLGALEDAQSALDLLESRIQSLEVTPMPDAGDGVAATPSPAVTARLGDLEQGVTDLRVALDQALTAAAADPGPATLAPDLSGLADRIAALEVMVQSIGMEGATRGSAATLVLAAGQLRDRLLGSGPFQAELNAIRQVAQARQVIDRELEAALNRLGGLAGDGVATVDELARGFSGLAGEIIAISKSNPQGWAAKVWGRLRGVISVRRTGEVEGDSAQARVARAELRLAERDLPGAVQELDALDGAAAAAVKPWLDRARARVIADQASALITTRAVALVARDIDPGP